MKNGCNKIRSLNFPLLRSLQRTDLCSLLLPEADQAAFPPAAGSVRADRRSRSVMQQVAPENIDPGPLPADSTAAGSAAAADTLHPADIVDNIAAAPDLTVNPAAGDEDTAIA